MRTKCISVRLKSLESISPKACRAEAYDGSTAILPKSQIFGADYEVQKSDAYWISEWILKQKELQYSAKKIAWFDENGNRLPDIEVHHHTPEKHNPVSSNIIDDLRK